MSESLLHGLARAVLLALYSCVVQGLAAVETPCALSCMADRLQGVFSLSMLPLSP